MAFVPAVVVVVAVIAMALVFLVGFILLAFVAAPMIMRTFMLAFSGVISMACFMPISPAILVSPVGTILPAYCSCRPLRVRVLRALLAHVLGCHSPGVCMFSSPSRLMPFVLPATIPCQYRVCVRNCRRQQYCQNPHPHSLLLKLFELNLHLTRGDYLRVLP
jgi:hypothetical protein